MLHWTTEETQHYIEPRKKRNAILNQRRNTTLYWTTEYTQHCTEPEKKHNAILTTEYT